MNRQIYQYRYRGTVNSRTAKGGSRSKERYTRINLGYVCKTTGDFKQHGPIKW